jgi:hypothetical protein
MDHQHAMAELQRKTNADKDSFAIENEKLRNELLEIKLKYTAAPTGQAG